MTDSLYQYWQALGWPLCRLLLGMAFGLLAANVLEALRWTSRLARLSAPLARAAHLREVAGASFALAFVSPAGANCLPAYLVHTPTIFLLTWPVLGFPAVIYVGLTLAAAALRTAFTVFLGRCLLPPAPAGASISGTDAPTGGAALIEALRKAWRRFTRRLPRLVLFTVPVYILMYLLQRHGFFAAAEAWLGRHLDWLPMIKPQALGIILLHLAAELGAALGAAGSALQAGGLAPQDVVMALMVGNILSTPMRAIRHQLPSYAGFYRPELALRLILANQGLRALSMALMAALYYVFAVR